jgi:hypothetical protein
MATADHSQRLVASSFFGVSGKKTPINRRHALINASVCVK